MNNKDYQWQLGLLGEKLSFKAALDLFHQLSDWIDTRSEEECIPLCLLMDGEYGKVVTHFTEENDWNMVVANAMYLGTTKVQKVPPPPPADEKEH